MAEDYEECLQYLRNQIAINNLKSATDDKFLLRFLRAKKFDRKQAFNLLKNYYSVRMRYREIFSNFVPSSVRDILQSGIFEVLPLPDQKGRKIFLGKVVNWDIHKYSIVDVLRAELMVYESALNEEQVQMNGVVVILDCRGFTWHHAMQHTPRMLYLLEKVLKNTFPLRYKELYVVYVHQLVRLLVNIAKPILTSKILKRVYSILCVITYYQYLKGGDENTTELS